MIEAALVAVAIALLLPAFAPLRALENGRDGRFRDDALVVNGLPEPILPSLCRDVGGGAESVVANRLCSGLSLRAATADLAGASRMLQAAQVRAAQAFIAPLVAANARIDGLRARQRGGQDDVLAVDDAIRSIVEQVRPYAARYGLQEGTAESPPVLACAAERVQAILADAEGRHERLVVAANVVLLFGAALDAHPATARLADAAALPAPRNVDARCADLDTGDTLAAAASLMAAARDAVHERGKSDAMQALLRTAGWQWAAWAALGLVLLNVSRLPVSPVTGCGLTLAAWACAAWWTGVAWPLASEHAAVPMRTGAAWMTRPAPFVVVMACAAVALLALATLRRHRPARGAWHLSTPLAYPVAVVATGIGWLVLLDLSANGHFGNRYLALYHQGHLWLAMTALCLAAFLREPIGRMLAWLLSLADGVAARVTARVGAIAGGTLLLAALLAVALVLAVSMSNMRQLTSELGRLWLIVGGAWFFFLRGAPLTERVARSGNSAGSLLRYVAPLLVVVAVLVVAMILTRDMGPLLIAGYGAGAFVAASVAMWSYTRHRGAVRAYALAAALFGAWIVGTTALLFKVGSLDEVAAARLENAAAPLASANDHLALVTWFQQATPPRGFGPGAVPWCGLGATRSCPGVPAQIQSDYTFTALVGIFGWAGAWALTLGAVLSLYAIVRRHARATRGEPRLVHRGTRLVNDDQAFVSWLVVAWVALTLCQLAVTVAGNLAVIPLTGVTFPYVSFGMTSLVINMAMLGFALNVRARARG